MESGGGWIEPHLAALSLTPLRAAFQEQSLSCAALGSPFMTQLMGLLARHWPKDTAVARRFASWPGNIGPFGAALPLRLAGGLHALTLMGQDATLQAAYPPQVVDDAALVEAVLGALRRHDAFLSDWIGSPPQTNEVRRSAGLIAAAHWLDARFGLPLQLSELGASAGLNLWFDQFTLDIAGQHWGPTGATVRLSPDWRGPMPLQANPVVVDRRGVDLNPLRPDRVADQLRLIAYLWPDQPDRIARTRAAMALVPAPVDKADAMDWLAGRLQAPWAGRLHLIYHTIAWQYFPPESQARGRAMIQEAGTAARPDAPLAWLSMEADADPNGAALVLRLWPGDLTLWLGRAGFHGQWVEWADRVG